MEHTIDSSETLFDKLRAYKRKYYSNQLIRGGLFFLALVFGVYLLVNALEFFGRFSPSVRAILFFSFLSVFSFSFYYWLINPLAKLYDSKRQLSNEEAARQIGNYFKDINDRLLNTLQLTTLNYEQNELLKASIDQKTAQLSIVRFSDAIDLRENNKYLKYVLIPVCFILSILFFYPRFFSESSLRILNFNRVYVAPAPFTFHLRNQSLNAFKNEDFPISLLLNGAVLPEAVYVVSNGRKYRMESTDKNSFNYTFVHLQQPFDFHFEAAGFISPDHQVNLIERPNLKFFNATLSYPTYLHQSNESLNNVGNLIVPEGTLVRWEFQASGADSLYVNFSDSILQAASKTENEVFEINRQIRKSENYQVFLKNKFSSNREKINYYVSMIPDKYPQISLEQYQDTTLFNYLVLGGNISDDHGLSQLKVFYRLIREDKPADSSPYSFFNVGIDPKQPIQNFYYQWRLDSLLLRTGDRIQYFVQVWDNDGVNGRKSTKSAVSNFNIPSKKDLQENIKSSALQTETQLSNSLNQVQKLHKEMTQLQDRLKNKKNIEFSEKKMAEDLIKKRQELIRSIEEVQKQSEAIKSKQEQFSEQSQQLAEKADKLNKLMNELLDEETKKLYQELQKLLEEKRSNTEILDLLNKIDNKENNLKKELERALEMFKQLQFDQKVENVIQELKDSAIKLEDLAQKENEKNESINQQQKLNEEFKDTKQALEELKKMDEELENPNNLENTQPQQEDISKEMEQSLDKLQKDQNKKASQSQKNAAAKMNELAKKLGQMQESQEMEQAQENLDHLRDILENLLTLSFDQEKLMKDFREVNQSDPRFIKLSQEQLKLKDDAKIVEDSLTSLAKRVYQIESFVTREVGAMNEHMNQSLEAIKQRRVNAATSKQQFTMTSINNLALMLNDVLKQMQQQMADARPAKGQNKKKGKPSSPSLGELQQKLNQQIQQLKQSNQPGRQQSEELSRLALEQEMIRKALQQLENSQKGKPGGNSNGDKISELSKMMEDTEKDLVNKKFNQNTQARQKDILTRLLESEKSLREREEEETRKAEKAKEQSQRNPPKFNDYILIKQKQIELLKTVPPSLSPYYKKEVDKYFDKIRATN